MVEEGRNEPPKLFKTRLYLEPIEVVGGKVITSSEGRKHTHKHTRKKGDSEYW